MKRFFWAALLVCGPAFAESVAESEARLLVLSDEVAQTLQGLSLSAEGITCEGATRDATKLERLFQPAADLVCDLTGAGMAQTAILTLSLSRDNADLILPKLEEMYQLDQRFAQSNSPKRATRRYYGEPPKGVRSEEDEIVLVLSRVIAGKIHFGGAAMPHMEAEPDALDILSEAAVSLDLRGVEDLPQVAAYVDALAEHKAFLMQENTRLRAVFVPRPEGFTRAKIVEETGPLGVQQTYFSAPSVYGDIEVAGVSIMAAVFTNPDYLLTLRSNGLFAGNESDGDRTPLGVYHDRGRVQLYLDRDGMLALIDGRALVELTFTDSPTSGYEMTAMEAVLAHLAKTDFTDF